jgi:CheY-like chemotaxis protein
MRRIVLVVEDDADIRAALAAFLEDAGFTVAVASNGSEGLKELARIERPCLILLDWWMPVLSGREFLEVLKAHPEKSALPVVVMTTGEPPPLPGIVAFLRKPFGLSRLLNLLEAFCPSSS